jgi:serine/threonine-protein kinase
MPQFYSPPAVEGGEGSVRPGVVLAGKYRVERILGTGGMGVVVAAHHLQLDERVALKFLLPEALEQPILVSRFLQEARAAAKIKGEHVARVSDVGQLENGCPYIVMDYLEGLDLAAWLKQRGLLPIEQAVDFVLQACEAVADAHALGIVHRDLKPANLFCVRRSDGQFSIKVLDFGISKVTTPGAPGYGMTRTTAVVGSPFYMAPEQMQLSKSVDARADIWALGVILFELVTGRPPFQSEALTDLAIKVYTEPTPSARALRPSMPAGLDQVIATCLAKDRAARFANISELAIALKDFGSKQAKVSVQRVLGTLREAGLSRASLPMTGEHAASTSAPPTAPPAAATGASWGATGSATGSATKSSRSPLVALAVASMIAGLTVTGVLMSRSSPHSGGAAGAPSWSPSLAAGPPIVEVGDLPTAPVSTGSASASASAKLAPTWAAPVRTATSSPSPASSTPPVAAPSETPPRPAAGF